MIKEKVPLKPIQQNYVDLGDGTHALSVYVGNSIKLSTEDIIFDRELLPTRYTVKAPYEGAAVGDVVLKTVIFDVGSGTVSVLGVTWENESTGVSLQAPTSIATHLEPIKQGDSLTLAQLLSAGLATASNQVTQIGYLADIADGNDRHASYKLVQSEDLGAGTKYILKSDGIGWLMIRKTYTDMSSTMSYAGPKNNPSVTKDSAWASRASLAYVSTVGGA